MKESIFAAASEITTPIALAALTTLALYGLYKGLVARGGSKLMMLIAKYLFILALVATVLAIPSYVIVHLFKPGNESLESRIININVKDMLLVDVFRLIAHQIGAVAAVDPSIKGTISLSMNGEVEAVMNEICYEVKSCKWEIAGGKPPALFVRPRP